jgi:hypothetical protein
MCTVPRKSGTFRDSAHKGLQRLQENYINTHALIHVIPSTQLHKNLQVFIHQLHVTVCRVVSYIHEM